MIATNSPLSIVADTPSRAWTGSSPTSYVLRRSRISIRCSIRSYFFFGSGAVPFVPRFGNFGMNGFVVPAPAASVAGVS